MPLADYVHWNEDATYMWWMEEGRHPYEPPEPDDDGRDWYDGPEIEGEQCWYCDEPITDDGQGAWIDDTDGDCCWAGENENQGHTPTERKP